MKSESRVVKTLLRVAPSLVLTLACAGVAHAGQPAPIMTLPCGSSPPVYRTFSVQAGTAPLSTDQPYIKASDLASWSFTSAASTCTAVGGARSCAGLSVTLPTSSANKTPDFTGTADSVGSEGKVTINAVTSGGDSCTAEFTFRSTSAGGGWGDPHLTTVDGIQYDFQSAGEFTALQEDGFVLQTRQSPVPTATVPITNAYTGITHCVAIYTAVATKLGSSRVTLQPSPGKEPDPKSMQVRVDGKIVRIGDAPYVVYAGGSDKGAIDGTITKHPDGLFEITDARGTQVVVTSNYWDARKVWYLNVNVYGTTARQGTMGKLAERSWLPALPNGSSLGAKPASEADRYEVLYEKFADAWRVTNATSLFDYKDYGPDVDTATFTRDEWPRNHPQSCAIEGQTSAQAATEEVAQQACAGVVNARQKADCVFDVMVTGNAGFGKSYVAMQRFRPLSPGWYSPLPPPEQKCEDCSTCKGGGTTQPPAHPWYCWPLIAIGIAVVLLLLLVLRALKKKP
ncbi:MAG TPA: hypothetical protein VFK05_36130 [Polyangiaceae bacterium]|nr:hypothetical protein [Polyangiaceae bacterium]